MEHPLRLLPEDGVYETILDGVTVFRSSHRVARLPGGFVLTIGILSLAATRKGGAWYSSALVALSAILGTRLMG